MNEEHIECTFDCYCKRVIKNAACDYYNGRNRRYAYETPIQEDLSTNDKYFLGDYVFSVWGLDIIITNSLLASALKSLSQDNRDIVLLTCCFDYPDRTVAPMMQMARRTVAYRRSQALSELRRYLCV